MYVTRRFLRSTMSPTASDSEAARKSPSAAARRESTERTPSTEPSPRRRAPRGASKSSDDVRAPESAAPVSTQVIVAAKSTSSRKKYASPRLSKATPTAALPSTDEDKPFVGIGLLVDARDTRERWCEAKILQLDACKQEAFVHYVGWNARHDAWLPVPFLAAHGSHTGESNRCDQSWNGETSLFRREGECEPLKRASPVDKTLKQTAKLNEKMEKKAKDRTESASPAASRKRRSRTSHDDDIGADEHAPREDAVPQKPKRAKRSQQPATAPVKLEDTSDAKGSTTTKEKTPKTKRTKEKKVKAEKETEKKERKPKRQGVRVVVATTDEASERKKRRSRKAPAVDMELDMDVRGDDASAEGDGDESTRDASARTTPTTRAKSQATTTLSAAPAPRADTSDATAASPKAKKPPAKPKKARARTAGRQSVPLVRPPVQLSATREKLAAIFRSRLQQRQALEALVQSSESDAAPVAPVESTPAAVAVSTAPAPRAVRQQQQSQSYAADDVYAHYHNVHQLQQYYHQQSLLAASTELPPPTDSDASPDARSGGVMDSRVIHARVDELERQRHFQQQQQLLHAYYEQAALQRERNVHELAASDAFLATGSSTWQQQQAPGDGDDASMDDAQSSASSPTAAVAAQLKTSATLASPDLSAGTDAVETDLSVGRPATGGCSEKRRDASNEPGSSVLYEFVL